MVRAVGAPVRVVIAGEALVDLVPDRTDVPWTAHDGGAGRSAGSSGNALRPLPGGSPLNVAVGLGRLGLRAGLLGPISDDPFGALLAARLSRAGATHVLVGPTTRPTTLAMVHLDAAGHATYRFYLEGTSATGLTSDDVSAALARDPEVGTAPLHVSLGAVTLATDTTGPVLAALMRDAATRPLVSFDPNVRPAVIPDLDVARADIAAAVGHVDLVKVSDADLAALHPGQDPLAVAGRWADAGPALVVVTRGAEGATAIRREGATLTVASMPVVVVDTVGAGDAFTSGLLAALAAHGLLERSALATADAATLRDALTSAARVAALTCTRAGSDPPTRAEVDALQ
jgi:fructokinase